MSLFPTLISAALVAASVLLATSCSEKISVTEYQSLGEKYKVVIERDIRGVPHVIGERDVDLSMEGDVRAHTA